MSNASKKHFVFIVGTRAQLIKVAPVIVECERRNISCTLLMTGQHLETMQDLLDEFIVKSKPVMAVHAKEHATVFSLVSWIPVVYFGVLKKLKEINNAFGDLYVLVHGDTLSTLIGALAGRHTGACIVHLESGLTSSNLFDPFPEEIIRNIVFKLSHIAMCPDSESLHKMKENYPKCDAVDTGGNTILDAIYLSGIGMGERKSEGFNVVVSIHRFQNIYNKKRLLDLVNQIERIASTHFVYFVLHPATRKRLVTLGVYDKLELDSRIKLLPRLGYREFILLVGRASCVLTDGGSNQEELAALGVPTIVMRKNSERSDGLGTNAVMEGSLSNGLVDYIERFKYKDLESSFSCNARISPSSFIVEYLVKGS